MKTFLVATSAVALVATMSIALAQTPKGEQGQKEMSQPPMKEGPSAEKDTPKGGERKDAPADKKAKQDKAPKDASKDTAKDGKKEASDKEKASKDTPKDGKKEATDKDKGSKDPSKEAAGKDKATKEGKGGATLTQEQRTKVQGSFAKHRGKSANVNITVNVGVAVPRTVQLYAIPADIVVIVPAYRRYRYFVVGDRVCIVDPDTYEIVEIIVIA
jgi:hypothetical protein